MDKNKFDGIKPITRSVRPHTSRASSRVTRSEKKYSEPEIEKTADVIRHTEKHHHSQLPKEVPFIPSEPKHSSAKGLWYIALICVVGFLFSLSFLFESATVTVVPKTLALSFGPTDVFTAQKDGTDASQIIYTVMTLDDTQSMKLPSSTSKNVSQSATGTAVLYNTYSPKPYKVLKNTRLTTPDGKIYVTATTVTIPGYTVSNKSLITPGSVPVLISALVPGEAGNIPDGDLAIVSLAKTAPATKIYGRTKTPISGGLVGTFYTVTQTSADAALGTLSDKLHASLVAKAKVQIPDGYTYFDGATIFTHDTNVQAPYSKDIDVPLLLHGTLTAYLIKTDSLTNAFAHKYVTGYANEPVLIQSLDTLSLVPSAPIDPTKDTSFGFNFTGNATLIWLLDPKVIATTLAGQKKSTFDSVLGGMVGVQSGDLTIKPFWEQTFPSDASKITVFVKKMLPASL